jgi:hypothetical protein
MFLHCHFSRQVWARFRSWTRADFPIPSEAFPCTEDWWLTTKKRAPKNHRRDFDTVAILVHWRLWKERNARIFQEEQNTVDRVFELIVDDINSWRAAGAVIGL